MSNNNSWNNILGAAALIAAGALLVKAFKRSEGLVSKEGAEILSDQNNIEEMNKAIKQAEKDNKHEATFELRSGKEVTVLV